MMIHVVKEQGAAADAGCCQPSTGPLDAMQPYKHAAAAAAAAGSTCDGAENNRQLQHVIGLIIPAAIATLLARSPFLVVCAQSCGHAGCVCTLMLPPVY